MDPFLAEDDIGAPELLALEDTDGDYRQAVCRTMRRYPELAPQIQSHLSDTLALVPPGTRWVKHHRAFWFPPWTRTPKPKKKTTPKKDNTRVRAKWDEPGCDGVIFPFQPPFRDLPRVVCGFPADNPPGIDGTICKLCGSTWVAKKKSGVFIYRYALRPVSVFAQVAASLLRNGWVKPTIGTYRKPLLQVQTLTHLLDERYFWIAFMRKH